MLSRWLWHHRVRTRDLPVTGQTLCQCVTCQCVTTQHYKLLKKTTQQLNGYISRNEYCVQSPVSTQDILLATAQATFQGPVGANISIFVHSYYPTFIGVYSLCKIWVKFLNVLYFCEKCLLL